MTDPHPDSPQPDPHPADPHPSDRNLRGAHQPGADQPDAHVALGWRAMRDWLADSLATTSRGAVLDVGPVGYDDTAGFGDTGGDVPCAQIVTLRGGGLMVRLSTNLMEVPPVGGLVAPRALLDRWNYEDRFRDCTHGYLLTASVEVAADICVAWFRDRMHVRSSAELGCTYSVCPLPHAS